MNVAAPPKYGMGARVRRKEDKALLTGAGRFTDDYNPAGTVRAVVLRSAMAHARITVNVDAAKAMPGVHLIMTHADIAGFGGLPCKGNIEQVDGSRPKKPPRPLLNGDVVRHVGDPIAFVVADTVEQARAAADAIDVDYDALPAVVEMEDALADGADQQLFQRANVFVDVHRPRVEWLLTGKREQAMGQRGRAHR